MEDWSYQMGLSSISKALLGPNSTLPSADEEHYLILREEVEAVVKALKMGKSAGVGNIVQTGGDAMIDIQTSICNKDLEDTGMADHMDLIPSYHTPNAGKATCSCLQSVRFS